MILIGYDGSADAQSAIDAVAKLAPRSAVTVLTVWETFVDTMTRTGTLGAGLAIAGIDDDVSTDAAIKGSAEATASEGAERASTAGLDAHARTAMRNGDISSALLMVADDLDAELIVIGTRGRSVMRSLMVGSVSRAVLHHADRAVMVVPSVRLVAERRRWVEHAESTMGVS